jgi:hypothetical protein
MRTHYDRRRGVTLMEMLIAGLIMSLVGVGIYNMIRASYDSHDRILDQNTSQARSRQAVDDWIDQFRGAANVTAASYDSITIVDNAGQNIRFWKSGNTIRRTINSLPSAGEIIVRNVQSVNLMYWVWTGTAWASTGSPSDVTRIGGLHATVTVQIGSSLRAITSDVKIRQRRLTPNP